MISVLMFLTVMLLHSLGAPSAPDDTYYPGLETHVEVEERFYPTGSSIPFKVTLTNKSAEEIPLPMSAWGTPRGLISVVDEGGNMVPPVAPPFPGGPPLPVPDEEVYKLPPGASLVLQYDVADLFSLQDSGTYLIRAIGQNKSSVEVRLFDCAVRQESIIEGSAPALIDIVRKHATIFSGTISVLHAKNAESGRTDADFLAISDLRVEGTPDAGHFPRYSRRVPAGAMIEEVASDYLGQIWLLIRAENRQSLFLWRLSDKRFRTLVPLTGDEITLRMARAWPMLKDVSFVVGGTKDALHTTTSVVQDDEDPKRESAGE